MSIILEPFSVLYDFPVRFCTPQKKFACLTVWRLDENKAVKLDRSFPLQNSQKPLIGGRPSLFKTVRRVDKSSKMRIIL